MLNEASKAVEADTAYYPSGGGRVVVRLKRLEGGEKRTMARRRWRGKKVGFESSSIEGGGTGADNLAQEGLCVGSDCDLRCWARLARVVREMVEGCLGSEEETGDQGRLYGNVRWMCGV